MLGLVLEGGGAKGSYQAGVIKAFIERGINFDGVMGTSIGSINGALVAQGEMHKCIELWESLVPSKFTDFDDEKLYNLFSRKLDRGTVAYLFKIIRDVISNKGLSIAKTMQFLRSLIDEDKVRETNIDFGLITISLTDKIPMEIFKEEIPYGMLHDYIMASSYHPTFRTELIGGKKYFDGGLFDNLPINPLIRRGYDEIIAVRTMSIMPHRPVIDDTVKVTHITPSARLGSTIKVYTETITTNMKMGYFDTLKVLDRLKGKYYYFENMDEQEFYQFLLHLSEETFIQLRSILNLEQDCTKGKVINKLIGELKMQVNSSDLLADYELFLAFIEKYGKIFDIDRYKIYNLSDYLQLIAQMKMKYDEIDKKNITDNSKGNKIFINIINNFLGER